MGSNPAGRANQPPGDQANEEKPSVAFAADRLALSGAATAQQYPTRNVNMVVPYAAGGPTDTVSRILGQAMGKPLGQTVIVENRPSAGGILGPEYVKNAKPDGYTILIHHIGMATTPTLYRQLRFNPLTDFEYIGLINDVPMTIIAKPTMPAKDFKEFLAYIKANKDKVSYANAGIGAASHLCGMLFMSAIQTDFLTVPYKGTGPAMNDLLGGQVDFMCDQTTSTTSQIKSGKVKVYGITSAQRVAFAARHSDAAGAGAEGRRRRHLARPVRAEGHAEAGARQAGVLDAGGAQGRGRAEALRRPGRRDLSARASRRRPRCRPT